MYHDYLARGVRAADALAAKWKRQLEELHRAFDSAQGSWLARWHSLLTPLQQMNLLYHRLRGDLDSYGDQAKYAMWSLLRLVPWIAGAVALGVLAHQGMATLRYKDADLKALGLVKDLAWGQPNSPPFKQALTDLRQAGFLERRLFYSRALVNQQDAAAISWNVDVFMHAALGLDADESRGTDLVDHFIVPQLADASQEEPRVVLLADMYGATEIANAQAEAALDRLITQALASKGADDSKTALLDALFSVARKQPTLEERCLQAFVSSGTPARDMERIARRQRWTLAGNHYVALKKQIDALPLAKRKEVEEDVLTALRILVVNDNTDAVTLSATEVNELKKSAVATLKSTGDEDGSLRQAFLTDLTKLQNRYGDLMKELVKSKKALQGEEHGEVETSFDQAVRDAGTRRGRPAGRARAALLTH